MSYTGERSTYVKRAEWYGHSADELPQALREVADYIVEGLPDVFVVQRVDVHLNYNGGWRITVDSDPTN